MAQPVFLERARAADARRAKDAAAGAVLVVAFAAALIGLLVLGPHLLARLVS